MVLRRTLCDHLYSALAVLNISRATYIRFLCWPVTSSRTPRSMRRSTLRCALTVVTSRSPLAMEMVNAGNI